MEHHPKSTEATVYRQMSLIREFEVQLLRECLKGLIPGYNHISAGAEALAVAVALNLGSLDWMTSTHRAHGHYIAKTGDIGGALREIFGRATGVCGGKGGTMHLTSIKHRFLGANGIVGASVPHAVGLAMAEAKRRSGGVAVAFHGDGAFNQGATLEAFNLASVFSLGVLFILEDNGFAESTASSWSIGGNDPVARMAGFGIQGVRVDGVGYEGLVEVIRSALKVVRDEQRPYFLHCDIPLFHGHYAGDMQPYRAKGEAKRERLERDCLKHYAELIVARDPSGQMAATIGSIEAEVRKQVAAEIALAKADDPPPSNALLRDVYAH